jgi:hypothetical protein
VADLTVSSISAIKAELLSRGGFLGIIIDVDQSAPVERTDILTIETSPALPRRRAQNVLQMATQRFESP